MSTPAAGASAQASPPAAQNKPSLTDVEVTFLVERPETKIKLIVKVGEDKRQVVINKEQPVQWAGTIRSPADAKIAIHTHRRNRAGIWVKFASARTTLTENPSPVTDDEQKISIVLKVHEPGTHSPQVKAVVAEVAAAKQIAEKKIPIVEKLKPILRVLEVLTKIGMPLKDINPAIGYTVEAVKALIEVFKLQETCREEALSLVDEFTSFLSIENHIEVVKKRVETRRAVAVMLDIIAESANFIREKTTVGLHGVIDDLLGSKYREKLEKAKKEFILAKDSFDRSVELEILVAVDGIEFFTESTFIQENLSPRKDAHFRPGEGCLEGTRVGLRERIMKWVGDVDNAQPNLFWLFGNAGSGKSTVANTVAMSVDPSHGFQLSCFFCKRDDPSLSNPRRLLPTLAYRFAQQHESYRAIILDLLRDGVRGAGITTTADIDTQFDKLFVQPLAGTLQPARPHLVAVDGLDECGPPEEQAKLASCLLALSQLVPWIKVFVTSRNESAIQRVLSSPAAYSCNIKEEMGINDDIRLYITAQATKLQIQLSENHVQRLVEKAAGLFIWCRTLFEYLREEELLDANTLLNEVLSEERQAEPWMMLYGLYDKILDIALGQREPNVSFMRTILSIVNAAARYRPISVTAIMTFLHSQELYKQYKADAVERVIVKLHAILYTESVTNGGIRAHHASVYDFLEWKASTSTDPSWKTPSETHRLVALGCLRTLRADLKFNICGIGIPVLNKAIPDLATRVATNVSEALQYSCQFWFIHVSLSTLTPAEVEQDVSDLLRTKRLLFWFESLSLLGLLRQIQFSFRQCMRKFFQTCPAIAAAAEDACRIVSSFADAMDSVPHIYLSALIWLPEDSATYKNLRLSENTSLHLIENKRKDWDGLVWESDQVNARSIAFSPDGRFVAYGTWNGDVYIHDSQTGAPEGEPSRGHQGTIWGVAYSPDGRFISTGSEDKTIRIWDARTGEAIFAPFEGHRERVSCVAFSPDGLLIASGSWDQTVRIWNAQTGKPDGEPLRHPDDVSGVAFSPDGRFIASGCDDRRVHVWDTSSRQEAAGPFQGHQNLVRTVAYSPDGHTIVSGSWDRTLRVWDARSGEAIGDPLQGHTHHVYSVTYSPDGRFILSGSVDGTVPLWDAASCAPIGSPLQALSGPVWSVAYSPDGSLIASAGSGGVRVWDASTCFAAGSQCFTSYGTGGVLPIYAVAYSPDGRFIASGSADDQIRIWSAQTGATVDQPVLRHSGMQQGGSILSLAYSPDGRFIVSGSAHARNSTVCVLNVLTGATISGPLQGHSGYIRSVAYSPDGRFVVSGSDDQTVRLWDVQANAASGGPLQVDSPVNSVAFSPDGHLLACGTHDGRIWLYDADTGAIREPIQAHLNYVLSVAFSPDGRHIASGSSDQSVKIWDVRMGEASDGPLQGHRDWIRCIAYSPDGRFISSGSDAGEVIIWDAQTGSAYRELRGPLMDINSVAYSPDGRCLMSGAGNGKIYVHEVSPEHDDVEARWIAACSQMDLQDGWVKDGDTLLLWAPVPHRGDVRFCAHHIIPDRAPNVATYSIDYRTLLTRYSGKRWTDIFAGFSD